MKYIKLYENINNSVYIKELTETEFNTLLQNNCKNFDFDDKPFYRGIKNTTNDKYYLNGKNRRVNYQYMLMRPFHLEFMRSDKWKGLPKKDKSMDFISCDNGFAKYYGNLYRVIPYDNAIYMSNGGTLVGDMNKKIKMDDYPWYRLSRLFEELNDFYNEHNKRTIDIKKMVDGLNLLFSKKTQSNSKSIKWVYNILEKYNMTFREYMEDAFSPKYYNTFNYDELLNKKSIQFCWTDSPVLLLKI